MFRGKTRARGSFWVAAGMSSSCTPTPDGSGAGAVLMETGGAGVRVRTSPDAAGAKARKSRQNSVLTNRKNPESLSDGIHLAGRRTWWSPTTVGVPTDTGTPTIFSGSLGAASRRCG